VSDAIAGSDAIGSHVKLSPTDGHSVNHAKAIQRACDDCLLDFGAYRALGHAKILEQRVKHGTYNLVKNLVNNTVVSIKLL